jgi:predicted HNH restriction endonuclease
MAKVSFGSKGKRIKKIVVKGDAKSSRPVEDVVREIKEGMKKEPGEDYREQSLTIHGLVCARCGREFNHSNRHILTVHHKDGNHHNNPPDGSNWENLCIYCHEDVHSREILGEYLEGTAGKKDAPVVYTDEEDTEKKSGMGSLGEKLQKAMQKKEK